MSSESQSLTFTERIGALPAQIYRAFTNSSAVREWLADVATLSAKEGGRLYLAWNDGYYASGEFTRLEPDKEIAFSWQGRGEPAATAVAISLKPDGQQTWVTVVHSGLGQGGAWDDLRAAMAPAWEASLANLQSVLTTGEDLRFTKRPMLGILVGEFDAAVAKKLGTPVNEGIRLENVIDGMSAMAAGLRPDDVLVALGGQPVTDWTSLTNALQAHRAGETIEVVFYRGAQKQTLAMPLSGRPIPEIPPTSKALAAKVVERQAAAEAELTTFLAEVTEAEADFRPAPDDWNVKEVLAHLIHSERGWHTTIADMIGGHEAWYDDWGGNVGARQAATLAIYPTVPALADALKRSRAETAALVASLPPAFADRKGTFWRLAYYLLEDPFHDRAHLEQMRTAVTAAREQA